MNTEQEYERICDSLWRILPKEQKDRVLSSETELNPEFLGFVDIYYHLSRIIPKDFTIYDFGCAENAQSFFFKDFKKYVAIEPMATECFKPSNCEIHHCTTGQFLAEHPDIDISHSFAICSYVPPWHKEDSISLVRERFKNVFTFYPSA